MKIRRLLLKIVFALALLPSIAFSFDTPMSAGGTTVPSVSVTNYTYASGNLLYWQTTDALVHSVISTAGEAKDLRVSVGAAPGVGKSWAVTLVNNGVDTALTCTIADAATSCSFTASTEVLAVGDTLSVKVVPTGTPTAASSFRFAWTFDSTVSTESMLIGGSRGTALTNSATSYNGVQSASATDLFITSRDQVIPTAGQIGDILVKLTTAPGSGKSYQFILTKNGADQVVNCTIADLNQTCTLASTLISVVPGDLVAVKIVPFGTPAAGIAKWAFKWIPDIAGEAIFLNSSGANLNNGGTLRYMTVSGTTQSWNSTEGVVTSLTNAFTAKKMYVSLLAAPGTGKSYTFKHRVNNADSGLEVVVSGVNTAGQDTVTTAAVTDNSVINHSAVSTGDPTITSARVSIVASTIEAATPTPTPTTVPGTATPTPTSTATITPGGPTLTPTPTYTPADPTRYACVKVTNLNDSGAGSLRDCTSKNFPRVCVFEVSGRIPLTSGGIKITNPDYVIAGQTAPGGGVMLTNSGLYARASNGWIEHIAVDPGDATPGEIVSQRDGIRVEQTGSPVRNVTFDHVSVRHAVDGSFDTYLDVADITIKDSLIGEPLYAAVPGEVPHSTAGLVNTNTHNLTWIRNFIVHSQNRNVQIVAGTSVEFINNYIYHYGRNLSNVTTLDNAPSRGLTTPHLLDYIGNKIVAGPTSVANAYNLYRYSGNALNTGSQIYLFDNRGPRRSSDAQAQTLVTDIPAGFIAAGRVVNRTTSGILDVDDLVTTLAPNIGSRPWARRPVDTRIITSAVNQTGDYVDCLENCGYALPDVNGGIPRPAPEGGYDPITPETRAITCDADYNWNELRVFLSSFEEDLPTPTPTVTFTPSNTPTPTRTATSTPTITPTPGPGTPTAVPVATSTPTRTATPLVTVTPALTGPPAMTATRAAQMTLFYGNLQGNCTPSAHATCHAH